MDDHEAHSVFRRAAMPVWLLVGGFSGLFWREIYDLALQIF